MDATTYKIIHIIGLTLLFFSLGGLFTKYTKGAVIGHGVALLLIIVSGFGLQQKSLGGEFPTWMIVKVVIWLAFGAMVALAKKGKLTLMQAASVSVVLAGFAAWLVFTRPF